MPRIHPHPFRSLSLILFLLLLIQVEICKGISVLKTSELNPWVSGGKLGESQDEEGLMDSESNRRVLQMRRRYISYETLERDSVPCDRPGASYYNCNGPVGANSYSRGCDMITRCARSD